MNVVAIAGNIGKDAETRYTAGGTAVTNFSVATEHSRKDQSGEWIKETTWHDCVLWKREGLAVHLTKGTKVAISGSLRKRSYEGNDGSKRTSVEIVVNEVTLQGGGTRGEQRPPSAPAPQSTVSDDDIPF